MRGPSFYLMEVLTFHEPSQSDGKLTKSMRKHLDVVNTMEVGTNTMRNVNVCRQTGNCSENCSFVRMMSDE